MYHWTITGSTMEEWEPQGGWNRSFSERERIQCTELFFVYAQTTTVANASILAHMEIFKQKYHNLTYSEGNSISPSIVMKNNPVVIKMP